MTVKVIIDDSLQDGESERKIKVPIKQHESIDTLLIKISRRKPEVVESILNPRTGKLKEEYNMKLNGRSIKNIKGIHTRLKDGDEVEITPENS